MSSILSKNELENFNFCPSLLGQNFFARFLEKFTNQKVLSKLSDLYLSYDCFDVENFQFKDLIFYILFRYYSRDRYFTARYCGEVGSE